MVLILSFLREIFIFSEGSLRNDGDLGSFLSFSGVPGGDNVADKDNIDFWSSCTKSSDFFFLNNPVKILELFLRDFMGGDDEGDAPDGDGRLDVLVD